MGVYIEGASMPKNCEECNFKVVCKPYCERVREQYTRPTWCPCIELTMQSSEVDRCKVCQQYDIGYEDGRLDMLQKLSDTLKLSEDNK